jgi:hypothetical protein
MPTCVFFSSKGRKQNLLDGLLALLHIAPSQFDARAQARTDNDTGRVVALANLSFGPGVLFRRRH